MKKLFQKSSILLLALSSLGLVACGEPAPTPTPSESESLVSESVSEEKVEVVSIEAARKAEKDTKLSVTGTVLAISYANGKVPNGVIIADDTSSIYVYGNDLAGSVAKGDKITISATKTYFIMASESEAAETIGYQGSTQLTDATLISKEAGGTWDKTKVPEMTVKQIMDTPMSQSHDITGLVVHANCLIKKVPGSGFVNYYIDDLDGKTGCYVYTSCNGADFDWLDPYDGKICSTYFTALNAKSTKTGGNWRFLPVEVIDEGFVFDQKNATQFALDYFLKDQFKTSYQADPAAELITEFDHELLNIAGVKVSYSSSAPSVANIVTDAGKTVFHGYTSGSAKIGIDVTLTGQPSAHADIDITFDMQGEAGHLTVKQAVEAEEDTQVVVGGIVGPSVVNQAGAFYLIDDTGVVAVQLSSASDIDNLATGNKVVLTGFRDLKKKNDTSTTGQIYISNCTITQNLLGSHTYSTASFIADKTLADIAAFDATDFTYSTRVYTVSVNITKVVATYYTNYYVKDGDAQLLCYASSGNQYAWLDPVVSETEKTQIELAPCNWNSKTGWAACVLSYTDGEGNKVLNQCNFKK